MTMNPVDFADLVKAHTARHPFSKLPDPDSLEGLSFFGPWKKAFDSMGADPETVTLASERLVNEPPKQHRDHWPTLRRYVVEAIRARGGVPDGTLDDTRETAEAASVGCRFCGGSGLAVVWNTEPSAERRIPESVAAYCECRLGRWIRRGHGQRSPDVLKRIADLVDIRAGRSVCQLDPPWYSRWSPAFSGGQSPAEMIHDLTARAREDMARYRSRPAQPETWPRFPAAVESDRILAKELGRSS